MAVVQISKIQIRRDIKDADPADSLPIQLAAGELAWCLDTNQLYIGTYQVSNPEDTRNVEILSEGSDIFNIGQYSYGKVATGVSRSVQSRLDDRVSSNSFGIPTNGIDDCSQDINFAIEKLYKDTLQGNGRVDLRAVLEFGPGVYILNGPIFIHSFTKIVGSGVGSTVFIYRGDPGLPAFSFTRDPTLSPNDDTDNLNQCKNVLLKGFTLEVDDPNTTAFDMFCVRNSEFNNIRLKSNWTRDFGTINRTNSIAIKLGVVSDQVTCKDNEFINLNIENFKFGISARGDISNNVIRDCKFIGNEISINFGYYNVNSAFIPPVGEQFGPRNNIISTCVFRDVQKHAVKVWQGSGNVSSKNTFLTVGNNFGGNVFAAYGQVEFDTPNNLSVDDYSDRHKDLGKLGSNALMLTPYIAEITGYGSYQNNFTNTLNMAYANGNIELFRFPIPRSSTPNIGPAATTIEIDYFYRSQANDVNYRRIRKGRLTLLVDIRNNATDLPTIDFIDDYDYLGYGLRAVGADRTDEDIIFEFIATPVQQNNQWQVKVSYKYNIPSSRIDFDESLELGVITYTYRILS